MQASLELDDDEVLDELSEGSATTLDTVVSFLEGIRGSVDPTGIFCQRALAVLITILDRIRTLVHSFGGIKISQTTICDNGYSAMITKDTKTRAKLLVSWLLLRWEENSSSLLSYPLLQKVVADSLPGEIDSDSLKKKVAEKYGQS